MLSSIKQNPFSLYDFIGYLIPGILFWGMLFYTDLIFFKKTPIMDFFGVDDLIKHKSNIQYFAFLFPFILSILYLTGHVLALLSNITIEQFGRVINIGKASGYLISEISHNKSLKEYAITYTGLTLTWNPIKFIINNLLWLQILIPETLFVYLICIVPQRKNNLCIEAFYKKENLYIPNFSREKIKKLIEEHFEGTFETSKITGNSNEYFHYIYHYVLENAEQHVMKIQNYVALYGFLRNTLMVSLLISTFILFSYFFASVYKFNIFLLFIILLVCNFILFYGYIKFERRYNEEVIFALSSLAISDSPQSNPSGSSLETKSL